MSARPETAPSKTPWLDGFEETDYSKFWETKRIEDEAQKRVVRGMIRPGGACLDLGGGFGRMTKVLEPYFREVVMMDLTRRNLRTAKDTLAKAGLVRSDVSTIPARDSSFDSVVMIRVVHLLPRPLETMKEVQRVSKDGAVLIISVPNLVTNYMIREFDAKVLPGIRHVMPTFGPAVWPIGDKPRLSPHELFVPSRFRMTERRGTGMFDNFMGKALNRFPWLHLIDVATSPFWYFKLDVFFRFEVRK
ncbi:MAG: class I SAM-dependent methyltransferase [Nitrososphaerota archaeon]|nr:class I SAM-dependent methyltransferase [Nitrososphaerota archaeon]